MKKKVDVLASQIRFYLFSAAVVMSLILATSTVSMAQKKMTVEDIKKGTATVIDINTADEKAIEGLPGIGKATAKAIVAGRPYKSVDELKRVKGMSDKKITAIKDMVTVGGTAPAAVAAPNIPSASEAKQKASSMKQEAAQKTEKTKSKLAAGQHVNINTATKEELDALPGIGPAKAQAIIDNRPYNTPEDIMKVKGIKQKTFDKLKDIITVK
jgi:competence protein ComEA